MRLTARPYWGRASLLMVTLPIVLLVLWYLGSGYTRFERYRRATGAKVELDLELLQLFVHDELHRHLRRLSLDTPPGTLDTIEISVPNGGMNVLEADARSTGKRSYVKVFLRRNKSRHTARMRLQGRRHWHHIGEQKSFKVKAEKGDLVGGLRTFNLINDVTPFGLEEQIVLDVAKELDLLTPEYRPVRVRFNNTDLGVYRLVGAPDEGLLRREGRMPGSLYSGRLDRKCDPSTVDEEDKKPCGFAKLGARAEDERERFDEIFELHDALSKQPLEAWRDYARRRLDLDRFARFEALDVVFGGDQHDEGASFKLYYDPYRGRFEPIAMDFRAFRHDEAMNLASNVLQRRLRLVPEYTRLRNRWIHELATGLGSPASVRARVGHWFEALEPELRTDPYWDAYKLLPKADKFRRLMVRPMTLGRWKLVSQVELETHARRNRFLLDRLDAAELLAAVRTSSSGATLDMLVAGHGAFRIVEVTTNGGRKLGCDLAGLPDVLEPEVRIEEDDAGQPRARPVRTRYALPVVCPDGVGGPRWVTVENLVTGRVRRIRAAAGLGSAPSVAAVVRPPAAPPTELTLGPGEVRFDEDRVFGPDTSVSIAAGTTVRLAAGVSLVFEGQLSAVGSSEAPISFVPATPGAPFGGVQLLGPKTRGSRLRHVVFTGGGTPRARGRYMPAFFTIYDTEDVVLANLRFEGMRAVEDVLHATYVQGLAISDVTVRGAPTDAIDLEMVQAELRGIRVVGAGDECLDLMGARLVMTDSVLAGCTNNAVSAGEQSDISLDSVLIANSKVAVLAKNASKALVARSLVHRTKVALRTNKKDIHYSSPSRIEAEDLFVDEVVDLEAEAQGTKIVVFRSARGLPAPDQLAPLRRDVLGLEAWSPEALSRLLEEGLR